MITIKNVFRATSFILIFAVAFLYPGYAQDSKDEGNQEKVSPAKERIDSKNFVFVAQSVTPLRRGTRQLTSNYEVIVSKDSVISDLPYFGRAYSAPINPSDAGLTFTSTEFEYSVKEMKKRGWNVNIKPKDQRDVRQLSFNIFDDGKAFLQVSSTYRDNISFNGYIRGRNEK